MNKKRHSIGTFFCRPQKKKKQGWILAGITWNTFKERFFSRKTAVIALLFYFIQHFFLSPLKQFSVSVKYPVTPYVFPFFISDIYVQIVFISIVIYFFSNAPFMQQNGMYQVIRLGRFKWAAMQLGSIFLSSVGLVFLVVAEGIIILLPNIQLTADWGKVLFTLSQTSAGAEFGMLFGIEYGFLLDYSPIQGMGISVAVSILAVMFIGLVMFAISLCVSRIFALSICSAFMALPIISMNIHVNQQLLFSCFSPLSWMQVTRLGGIKYGYPVLPPLSYAIIVLFILLGLLCLFIFRKAKTVEFQWTHED